MKNFLIIGLTFDVLGTLLIAYTILRVHYRISKEHHIDQQVIREMSHERLVVIIGALFIVVGYILQIVGIS